MARYSIENAAKNHPDKVALMLVETDAGGAFTDRRWTFAEIDEAVRRVAGGLVGRGLAPGDIVMIRLDNSIEYALLYFGAMAAGMIALPSSAQLTEREAGFLLADSGARLLAVSGDLALDTDVEILLQAEVVQMAREGPPADYADTGPDDPAFLIYTSGTTGTPKGVLHGHRHAWGRRPMYQGWYGIREDDVILHSGAFNWTYTLGVGLTDPWANGATTVLYNGPRDAGVWGRLFKAYRPTIFVSVPGLYRQILKYTEDLGTSAGSLRHGLVSGEALPLSVLHDWRRETGTELYEALGMSEISTFLSHSPASGVVEGSPGRAQPGRRISVLDEKTRSRELAAGETGVLAVHRTDPGLMLGYLNRPEEEADAFRGEWFTGGDLASIDADGNVFFHGRRDDVMTAGGYRVSPLEVEEVLVAHDSVLEAAVTELRISGDLTIIAAFLVPAAEKPAANDLDAWCAARLARYKCPREFVFVEALPRTANGKILRRDLPALVDK